MSVMVWQYKGWWYVRAYPSPPPAYRFRTKREAVRKQQELEQAR